MTAPHDLDRQLDAFLRDGPTELPDPSFDAVRDRMEVTSQRVFIGPWRFPDMNKLIPIGLGAAALVVAVFVGARLLGPAPSGPGTAPSVAPSITAEPTTTAEPSVADPSSVGGLPEGSSYQTLGDGLVVSVIISAPGWHGDPSGGVLVKNGNADPPDGAGLIIFAEGDGWYVPGDPCNWNSTMPESRSTTVDQLVAALAAQASREASAPADIALDGYGGKSITLHVPDDPVVDNCDGGQFCTLADPVAFPADACARYHQGPGQIDEMWIVDVDGQLVIIDWSHYEGTPPEDVAEMRAIVESTTFE